MSNSASQHDSSINSLRSGTPKDESDRQGHRKGRSDKRYHDGEKRRPKCSRWRVVKVSSKQRHHHSCDKRYRPGNTGNTKARNDKHFNSDEKNSDGKQHGVFPAGKFRKQMTPKEQGEEGDASESKKAARPSRDLGNQQSNCSEK